MYSSLFKEKYVIDHKWMYDDIKKEFDERIKFNLPPGYKDKAKEDGGLGDFIIWKDIIKIGEDYKSNIIFVTGDEKADWFHQSMSNKIYPRYELVHEFKEKTNGRDVHFISLSDLIEIYSKEEEIIDNIRSVEKQFKYRNSPKKRFEAIVLDADSKCKLCGIDGSFDGNNGLSFLEMHHIKPLSKGGVDEIDNIVVLCPNCHKMVENRKDELIQFNAGPPCQMSGQICPACKIGTMNISKNDEDGVECNICGIYIPA
jgi:5-methylcytosine-specific restriction endonuclease McrA